ncbi:regulator of G-protein signaling 5-like [Microtus pennsylvanicus]|uniref:regulator of G-protein signaling 5-like n=1 Tax=Microtus pennsylvanicus TaxID=10058 RepID=UPI003F6CFC52
MAESRLNSEYSIDKWEFIARVGAKEIKIKLGILLQKPDSVVDLVMPYNEKPEKPAKTHKPSLDKALQWRHSLAKLLHNNCKFMWFSRGSEWGQIQSTFILLVSFSKLWSEHGKGILRLELSSWPVNFDHFTKDITMKNLVEPSRSSFDLAQ